MNTDYRRRVAVMQSQQVQPQLQPQRRNPLTANNVQQPPHAPQQTPPKPPPKGASPPLPRQNSKTTPPTPPKVIVDRHNRFEFTRVGFLGEGGFARVFEVKDPRDTRLACKVITKTSLKTKKAKTKASIVSRPSCNGRLTLPNSYGQRLKYTAPSNTPILFASMTVLRMGRTCT